MKRVYGWADRWAGVRYVITKFLRWIVYQIFLPMVLRSARGRSSAINVLRQAGEDSKIKFAGAIFQRLHSSRACLRCLLPLRNIEL